eukprot:TRINITY_DN3012_c0_g1_i5.p1 TRINITY_DN3012_c0_g1~~TRINITY_DN3012_c0_g1_i5.p1  ORF type:complete len:419 (-),score=68.44 TRINITY_DN3012_c0_g1_i5:434-1690(-)
MKLALAGAVLVSSFLARRFAETPPLKLEAKSIVWYAPFYSQSGYGSEARAYVLGLQQLFNIKIVQHGDGFSQELYYGLDDSVRQQLRQMEYAQIGLNESVVICHSEPGAWDPPRWPTSLCPPPHGPRPMLRVGRTMFETDRIPSGWELRLNKMDEVWVPSAWAVHTFAAGGVAREKLVRIPEPVDTSFFDPAKVGSPLTLEWNARVSQEDVPRQYHRASYAFLSIFKWEARKGWDVLLRAYFEEFSIEDDVSLHILTHGYHATKSESEAVAEFVQHNAYDPAKLPRVQLITDHVPGKDLPRLYAACDAFVLPSRGEGWGRPHVEAMSMGLPLISTNWSGPTEFMTVNNSFPLEIEKNLVPLPADSAFAGHLWAQPSVTHLRQLMRKLVNNPELGVKATRWLGVLNCVEGWRASEEGHG